MDQTLSNYTTNTLPSSNPDKRLLTGPNPLTATNPLTGSNPLTNTNPFTGAVSSSMNPLQKQPYQQHQQQLMGPMSNPVAQQLLGMTTNALPHQPRQQNHLMGPKSNPMLNSMMNPMRTPMHREMVSPAQNLMMQQQDESERNSIFSASDDNVIMKQVMDTHIPDGTDVDVKPLVHIVEEILRHATITADPASP
ncbi:sieve element occlusion B-like protein, partial [Tanacetum coccineum]